MTRDIAGVRCDVQNVVAFAERVNRNEGAVRLGIIVKSTDEQATVISEDERVVLLYPGEFSFVDENWLEEERYNNLLDLYRMVK